MIDFLRFGVAPAFAADEAAPVAAAVSATGGAEGSGDVLMRFMPLFLIFLVFYFLLIRPQQKKLDAQGALIKALEKGDKVELASGIVGTVAKVPDDGRYLILEIAKGTEIKVLRSSVAARADETRPVKADAKDAK